MTNDRLAAIAGLTAPGMAYEIVAGEEVGATLYADGPVDEAALRGFLLEHIARFKIPRYLRVVREPLPRIASGKIDKRRLRQQFVASPG